MSEPLPFEIQRHRGLLGLSRLADDWAVIAAAMSRKGFHHRIEWMRSQLEALEADPDAVCFFVLHRGGRPEAIFPLRECTRRVLGLEIRALEGVDHAHLPFGDFLVADDVDPRAAVGELLGWLAGDSGIDWHCLSLCKVVEGSAAAATSDQPGFATVRRPSEACDELSILPYEELSERFSRKFRRGLKRYWKRAEAETRLERHCASKPEELEEALDALLEVETAGWKGAEGSGSAIRLDPALLRFYRLVVQRFSSFGGCSIHSLRDGERTLCASLGLVTDGSYFGIKMGYDPDYAALAPGVILVDSILQSCAGDPRVERLNFCSSTPWNRSWGPVQLERSTITLFRGTLRGRFAHAVARTDAALRRIRRDLLDRYFVLEKGRYRFEPPWKRKPGPTTDEGA